MKISHRAFTLIELLVVISIIGILMSLSLVAFQNSRASARDSKRRADLEQIRSALEIYRADTNTYPEITGNVNQFSAVPDFSDYLPEIPNDPLPSHYYYYSGSANTYTLCALLETGGSATCGNCGTAACNYQTTNP